MDVILNRLHSLFTMAAYVEKSVESEFVVLRKLKRMLNSEICSPNHCLVEVVVPWVFREYVICIPVVFRRTKVT